MDDSLASGMSTNLPSRSTLSLSEDTCIDSEPSTQPTFVEVRGKRYELVKQQPNKRGKTSWIWKEGLKLLDLSNVAKPMNFWMCQRCHDAGKNVLYSINSTTHASDHLRDVHQVAEEGSVLSRASNQTTSPRSRGVQIDFVQFKDLLVRWTSTMHISFSQLEYESFRNLLLYLNPEISSHLPSSGNTIRNWILEEFKRRQDQIKKELSLSKSLVHFSFDMWTSPNFLAMLGITAHHVSHTGEAKDCLIGLKRVIGSHSGENMAQSIIAVIEKYGLKDRLGYFMLDNAKSNDTCVRSILAKLRPDLDPKERRLRCFGHIINLAVKAFLFGKDPEAFVAEAEQFGLIQQEEKELKTWRKLGPLGKLHNVVEYIRKTPQRREAFVKLATDDVTGEAKGKIDRYQDIYPFD